MDDQKQSDWLPPGSKPLPPPKTAGAPAGIDLGGAFALAALFGLVLIGVKACGDNKAETSEKSREFSYGTALELCQYAIRQSVKDPEKTTVPRVEDSDSGPDFYFAWGRATKLIRSPNGLGIEIGVSAHCMVSEETERIIGLSLDGKTII